MLFPKIMYYAKEVYFGVEYSYILYRRILFFPGGSNIKNLPTMQETGSVPGLRRSPGEGNGYAPQYSCLENVMNKGTWWAIAHGVTKLDTTEMT